MIEKRFYLIRDKGFNGGIPTYSQATKVMRILSALMNYAMADEMIERTFPTPVTALFAFFRHQFTRAGLLLTNSMHSDTVSVHQ